MLELPPVIVSLPFRGVKTELLQWLVQQVLDEDCELGLSQSYFDGITVKTFGQKSRKHQHDNIRLIPAQPLRPAFWPNEPCGDVWATSCSWSEPARPAAGGRLAINAVQAFVGRLTEAYNEGLANGFPGYVDPSEG